MPVLAVITFTFKSCFICCIHYFLLLFKSNLGEGSILNFIKKRNIEISLHLERIRGVASVRPDHLFRQKTAIEPHTSFHDLQPFTSTHQHRLSLSLSCSFILIFSSQKHAYTYKSFAGYRVLTKIYFYIFLPPLQIIGDIGMKLLEKNQIYIFSSLMDIVCLVE